MPRKAQSPRDETDATAPADTIHPQDLELADLVKQFPEARRVTIGRYNRQTDRWAHLGSVPSEMFSEDMLQHRWGGGLFQARFRNGNGHIIHSINAIEIEADPDRPPVAPDIDKVPTPAATPAAGENTLITLMLSEIQASRTLMLEIVRGMADRPAPPQNDLVAMVTALGAMQGLLPKPSTPLPEKIIEKILDGAMKGPAAAGGNEWVGLIKDVLVEFKPALQRALVQTAPSSAVPIAAPIATAALPEPLEGDDDVTANRQDAAIGWLKAQYATGAKPAELGPIVLAFVDKAQIDLLLAKTDEQIFTEIADPDLAEPGLRVWFLALFEGLRALRNIPNPVGTRGNTIDADAHGGIS